MQEQVRRVVGLTHDGLEVPRTHKLIRSSPQFYGWNGLVGWGDLLSWEREINTDWDGAKKPYWSVYVLGFHIQFGWLWG